MEIRQLDQIRHCIIFNQVGEGYSGLYRVRAVNCLGEAECEAELSFDGENGGEDMFLPPIWKEKRRLNWRDEDKRKKPFVGFNEPELSSEEIEAIANVIEILSSDSVTGRAEKHMPTFAQKTAALHSPSCGQV